MLIHELKGIGEKTEKLFNKLGVYTVEELVNYYPVDYDVYKSCQYIDEIDEDTVAAVYGIVVKTPDVKRIRNLAITSTFIRDEKGNSLKVTWFNMPFLRNSIKQGARYVFRGKVSLKKSGFEMDQPAIYKIEDYDKKITALQPKYRLTKGLTNNAVTKAVRQAISGHGTYSDYLPDSIRRQNDLPDYNYAVNNIHFPVDTDTFYNARKRLVFDEFFMFMNTLRQFKESREISENRYVIETTNYSEQLLSMLPYELTNAQSRVWEEIKNDMKSDKLMNRLIQGDVGSGKTIVAILALLAVNEAGYQGALMAPTEVLACQHYTGMVEMFEEYNIGFKPVLLTGSMTAKEKREVYELIKNGEADIIIGTHALIQEKVDYLNLGLVITDEQHRFGVKQREKLSAKGYEPHTIVMSATPIPRTLAIIMYGDLDISVIDELPANRLPIKNCVVGTSYRPKAYKFIADQVALGRQAYVICPMVEESENLEAENVIDYARKLKEELPASINVDYLHGKMKPAEKNEKMDEFAANHIQVLVSTTVVEVGVNVPNATVMMVENAERFGLSALHQLRGRVGRGKHQSYCIFVSGTKQKDKLHRLEILNKSNDGFYIANEDLKTRGPGDIFGIRQSGDMRFSLGDIMADANILKAAADAANAYIDDSIVYMDGERERLNHAVKQAVLEYTKSICL